MVSWLEAAAEPFHADDAGAAVPLVVGATMSMMGASE